MEEFTFTIDGKKVSGRPGQTIMEAADEAGIYIPRLCSHKETGPHGSCRICMVIVNGRPQPACIQPAAKGINVENNTEFLLEIRRALFDMLFIEGNHYCMFCEKSGECELQALGYRLGVLASQFPFIYPKRDVDASHRNVFIEHNRCILCARCVHASKDIDKKEVFGFVNRGRHKKLAVNKRDGAAGTNLDRHDMAVRVCPVGTLMPKHAGYRVPIGRRVYDKLVIGHEIESSAKAKKAG